MENQENNNMEQWNDVKEKKGTSVVMWIIGSLIVLGLCYAAWSIYMVS